MLVQFNKYFKNCVIFIFLNYILQISIQLPNTKIVKNIIDKLKKIANKVTISATTKGTFSLLAKTTSATIEIHFKDLIVKKLNNTGKVDIFYSSLLI